MIFWLDADSIALGKAQTGPYGCPSTWGIDEDRSATVEDCNLDGKIYRQVGIV